MYKEIDYKRKNEIVIYIENNSELLIRELGGIYENNLNGLKNILIRARMGYFWQNGWDSFATLTELLKDHIKTLTSKEIYKLFEILNIEIALSCINNTFKFTVIP